MPVLLPCDFAIYANGLVKQALIDAGLQETNALDPAIPACSHSRRSSQETEGLYMWTITSHLMWQQVDRRIDEVFELLRAFRKANDPLSEEWQAQRLKAGLLRHESQTEVEEHEAFARWVGKRVHLHKYTHSQTPLQPSTSNRHHADEEVPRDTPYLRYAGGDYPLLCPTACAYRPQHRLRLRATVEVAGGGG
ncbi:hypothetical protein B0H10DRAFT_2230605 [Mycena sp. CBHHK59/15]|nr:hypothetical protein B0H10DRAFT_2230605 [Mycena sp. CBHHK59/15]